MRLVGLMAAFCLAQDVDRQKEFEKTVAKAVADFQKAFASKSESDRAGAVDMLRDLPHDKVFVELAKCLADAPSVRRRAVAALATMDHPRSAELLAGAVKGNLGDKGILDELVNAMNRQAWDVFFAAMGENLIADKAMDPAFTGTVFIVITTAERTGSVAFIEPLIKCLKVIDEKTSDPNNQLTGNAAEYVAGIRKALVACSGQTLGNAAAYESWWKKNKAAALQKARWVMWCKATGNRWDRSGADAKAFCPHHEDKQQASRETAVVAMRTFK